MIIHRLKVRASIGVKLLSQFIADITQPDGPQLREIDPSGRLDAFEPVLIHALGNGLNN
jgi:hypothetical protein